MEKTALIFAPHNDDELLGAGGALCKLSKAGYEVTVCEVSSGETFNVLQEEAEAAHKILGVSHSLFLKFPSCQLHEVSKMEINDSFSQVVQKVKPEIVFIPHYGDMHLDHRTVAEAAMVALRPINTKFLKRIYGYETLSETEWNTPSVNNTFIANTWFDISQELETKIKAMECYQSQLHEFPHPRSLDAIRSLAMYRGSTIGVHAAEAFILIRGIE